MSIVIYTDKYIQPWAAGCARGPLIFIRPKYKDDVGLLKHEQTHVLQWWCTLGLHSILYSLFDSYKLWAEVQAYKVQASCYQDDRRPLFASFIATRYDLQITDAEALMMLNR